MGLIDRFLKLPRRIIFTHIFAKFLFGLGLGMLLAVYIQGVNWAALGWVIIIISILLSLLGLYYMLKK